MSVYGIFQFGQERQAAAMVRLHERFAAEVDASSPDFQVLVSRDQILCLRQQLHSKKIRMPADFRGRLPLKRQMRYNMARGFVTTILTLEDHELPGTLSVPLPFWRKLVDWVVDEAPKAERPRLSGALRHYMLRQDTMTFYRDEKLETDYAINP